ncbi:MAG: TIM barrel protein, partial [Kiritimatiellae bacterium]|nr:TIM barrel protein [Kiritimatiellia bacterium]
RARSWKPEDFDALRAKVREWRASGGRVLSLHLSELSFAGGAAHGVRRLCDDCRDALELCCDRVTLHVPKIPASDYDVSGEGMRHAYAEALAPLAGTGIAIGVENMHVTAADRADWNNRRFGYTPEECKRQVSLLREIPGLRVGFHLDIGHARNNAPFSTQFPVGAWYEQLGAEVNGMHIHQVERNSDGSFRNHRPLRGFFEPLISLASLVMARQRGILPRAPMFLEIRDGLGQESWLALANAASRASSLL